MGHARFHVEHVAAGSVRLSEDEGRHAHGSRRLSAGDELTVFDGAGREAEARILSCGRDGVEVEVREVRYRERPTPALTIAVALPKGPRQDTLIEKCTELGVASVRPLETERSVSSASEHRLSKWQRTAIEAAKQSGQCWVPELHPLASIDEVVKAASDYDVMLVADVGGGPLPDLRAARRVLALVGPEGGWTETERAKLLAAGASAISLGPNILRIETAAIALAAIVHAAQTNPRPQASGVSEPRTQVSGSSSEVITE
jgi:16S rRNA (uracil1498-N3)-methyltransferase